MYKIFASAFQLDPASPLSSEPHTLKVFSTTSQDVDETVCPVQFQTKIVWCSAKQVLILIFELNVRRLASRLFN